MTGDRHPQHERIRPERPDPDRPKPPTEMTSMEHFLSDYAVVSPVEGTAAARAGAR